MKLSPVQLRTLTMMKDKDLIISTPYGASYLEKDSTITFSDATLRILLKNKLIDAQHDGAWNSGCQTHQITELGTKTLEENLK